MNSIPPWGKKELVLWLVKNNPNTPKSKFIAMKKNRLWAIFFSQSN